MSVLDTIFTFLGYARYNSTPPTVANNAVSELQCDASGNLKVALAAQTASPPAPTTTWTALGALTYKATVKPSSGKVYSAIFTNNGGSARWFMLFDKASAASNGDVPIFRMLVPGGASASVDFDARPRSFSAGLVWSISSAANTLTEDNAATFSVQVEYS